MRAAVGAFGILCGAIVVALVARYGYRTADTEIDGVISAFLFGTIAAGGLGGHAVAVRVWRRNWVWALIIGVIAALALTVNLSNSLGAIAGRGDAHTAERMRITQALKDDRAEFARITRERESMPAFVATDGAAVTAAQQAVVAAERVAAAECDKRGNKCRERESEAQTRRSELAAALANRAATERAAKLDEARDKLRERMATTAPVQTINPQISAMLQLFHLPDAAAASAITYQHLAVAMVVELLIVGALVAFEVLGQGTVVTATPASPAVSPVAAAVAGDVGKFLQDCLQPAAGQLIEVGEVYDHYRAWCARLKLRAMPVDQFAEPFAAICADIGVRTRARGKKVYCVDVALAA